MATAVVIDDTLTIPGCDGLAGFRGWTRSPGFPSTGRIDWIAGRIEVEMSPESLFTHGTLKTEIAATIYARVRAADLGEVFIDRTRLVCPGPRDRVRTWAGKPPPQDWFPQPSILAG